VTKKVVTHVTLKPKRPSDRVEILFAGEKEVVRACENSFDEYQRLVKVSPEVKANGIAISDIQKLRKEVKAAIDLCWKTVDQFGPVLTKRRTAIMSYLPEKERKVATFSKATVDKVLAMLKSDKSADREAVVAKISPIAVLLKVTDDNLMRSHLAGISHTGSRCSKFDLNIIPVPLQNVIFAWASMFNIGFYDRKIKAKKNLGIRPGDRFADEDQDDERLEDFPAEGDLELKV
jgi:hypothetical protein